MGEHGDFQTRQHRSEPGGAGTGDVGVAVAYEIVYDCRDRAQGRRLAQELQEVVGPGSEVRRLEDGPTWSVALEFPSERSAGSFFDSDVYQRFCNEVRRSCRSSVLVVPLGPVDEMG